MTSPNFPTPFIRACLSVEHARPPSALRTVAPNDFDLRGVSPEQRLARVSSWCNVQISQASRKRYKHPSTTGRSLVFLKRRTAYPFFLFRMPDTSFHGPASGVGKRSYMLGSLPGRLDKHPSTTRPFRNPGRPFILWPIRAG